LLVWNYKINLTVLQAESKAVPAVEWHLLFFPLGHLADVFSKHPESWAETSIHYAEDITGLASGTWELLRVLTHRFFLLRLNTFCCHLCRPWCLSLHSWCNCGSLL